MMSRILVPLDGSLEAERAIPIAAQVARHSIGTVVLAHIAPARQTGARSDGAPDPSGWPHRADVDVFARIRAATQYLAYASAHSALDGVCVETSVYSGARLPTILAAARAADADAIVIYDRDSAAVEGQLLGSVAYQVATTAEVPVLVVRGEQAPDGALGEARSRPLRAVVGLDGSPHGEALLPEVARTLGALASPGLGTMHLVHVARDGAAVADAQAYLSAVAHDLRREVHQEREHAILLTWSAVHDADPAAALLTFTDRPRGEWGMGRAVDVLHEVGRGGEIEGPAIGGADLLVVADGTPHRRRGHTSGTLERVLRDGTGSVLVMRPRLVAARADASIVLSREAVAHR